MKVKKPMELQYVEQWVQEILGLDDVAIKTYVWKLHIHKT